MCSYLKVSHSKPDGVTVGDPASITSCEDRTRQREELKGGINFNSSVVGVFRKTQILRVTTDLIAFRSRRKSGGQLTT